jgi:hypothetical protein
MASFRELAGALEALARAVRLGAVTPTSGLLTHCERLAWEAQAGHNTETRWTAFEEAAIPPQNADAVERLAKHFGFTEDRIREMLRHENEGASIVMNSRYQVMMREMGEIMYLSIKRIDQKPIRNWRDLQRIKNELVGPECEGLELFPAESRLLDSANQYHLFVLRDPSKRLPFGHKDGRVVNENADVGEAQEPFEA